MDGNIKTAKDRLCITGTKSAPPPDILAKTGDSKYMMTAKTAPKSSINFRNSRMRVKLCSSLSIVLYLATCLATATGTPAVEISKNQA